MGFKATVGTNLRGKPKGQKAGKFITNQRRMGISLTKGVRVIRDRDGQMGTIAEAFTLTVAVVTIPDGRVISGRYDEFTAIGNRYASHGAPTVLRMAGHDHVCDAKCIHKAKRTNPPKSDDRCSSVGFNRRCMKPRNHGGKHVFMDKTW